MAEVRDAEDQPIAVGDTVTPDVAWADVVGNVIATLPAGRVRVRWALDGHGGARDHDAAELLVIPELLVIRDVLDAS